MIYRLLDGTLNDLYYNPEVVLIASGLLILIMIFAVLTRTRVLGENRGVAMLIAIAISGLTIYKFQDYILGLQLFSVIIVVIILISIIYIFRPFFRFTRRQIR